MELQQLVRRAYTTARQRNPQLSLRSFARFLGINPTTLSLFLNGRRQLSVVSEGKVRATLKLATDIAPQAPLTRLVKPETHQLVHQWHHYAILSLMELADFNPAPDWVAKRLNIGVSEVEQALEILTNTGFITKENGDYRLVNHKTTTTEDVPVSSIRDSHRQGLELAANSLTVDEVDQRHFSSVTLAINPDQLGLAAKKIQKFRQTLAATLATGPKKEVYRFGIQIFPLSRS